MRPMALWGLLVMMMMTSFCYWEIFRLADIPQMKIYPLCDVPPIFFFQPIANNCRCFATSTHISS